MFGVFVFGKNKVTGHNKVQHIFNAILIVNKQQEKPKNKRKKFIKVSDDIRRLYVIKNKTEIQSFKCVYLHH